MDVPMRAIETEKRDWAVIVFILLLGLLFILIAGGWALRFTQIWELDTNVESRLDPNSDFLTHKPDGFIEPVDPAILTNPAWMEIFLTPGASTPTRMPPPQVTDTLPATQTVTLTSIPSVTNTPVNTPSPTNAIIFYPPLSTSTSKPKPAATDTPTFTPSPIITSTPIDTSTPTSTPSDTPVPSFLADLSITNDDGATNYVAGGTLTYTVIVTNYGPDGLSGVVISDIIPPQIMTWSWACTGQNNGASGCDPVANGADFNDIVDLPNGASIVYTVTANISPSASGDLVNTSSVSPPAGYTDTAPGNNFATDTDRIITSSSFPSGNIGTSKDGSTTVLSPGSSVTLMFSTPINVASHAPAFGVHHLART